MDFGQFLMGQGRAKIRIASLEQLERLRFDLRIQLVMAAAPTLFREQRFRPTSLVRSLEPFDLADAQTQALGGLALLDLSGYPLLQHLGTTNFFGTHL